MRLLKVGRASNCDIVLRSDRASALHAEITLLNNGDILLEDKNSRNGTFIMNRPIKPGTQVSIKRGDAIRFGDVELLWDQVPYPEDLSRYKAVYGIGKSMRNDIQIAGNTVSRYHATLKIGKDGKAFLQDHSSNGSTINGERLNPGQTRQVKRSDSIVCGGVPVNLSQFIPANPWPKIVGIAAAIAVLIVSSLWVWPYISWNSTVSPVTPEALEHASVCVYGGYYVQITLDDDPLRANISGWPKEWYIGRDPQSGRPKIQETTDNLAPWNEYTGTAFFISENGELGTNRHIAVPWKYLDDSEIEIIRQLKGEVVKNNQLMIAYANSMNQLDDQTANSWIRRFENSDFEINGKHSYFGIGLTGYKIDNILDLYHAQVIAESEDDKKDVALIRLKQAKTPEDIVKMGAIYDIEKARIDEQSLIPQKEELNIVGYPIGDVVGTKLFNGTELHPTNHSTRISKVPDDNQIQIQATGVGGLSGSPVSDSKHRLVGVLCSGFRNTDVTYCCNIKHLVELYNKHRVRE